jgi:hypothetical protein
MQKLLVGRRGAAALAAAVAAVVIVAALVGTASAHKPRIASHVTIHETFDTTTSELVYYGRVTSRKPACERGRRVTLHNSDGVVGTTRSNRRGHWEVRESSNTIGGYFVTVARKERLHFICRPTSETLPNQ